MDLTDDLTNIAFWIYCNKIANRGAENIDEITSKLKSLITKYCALSFIIMAFQMTLTILVMIDIYNNYREQYISAVAFGGDSTSFDIH